MLIDCDRCPVRGPACPDCVVTVLLGSTPQTGNSCSDVLVVDAGGGLDAAEARAVAVLADAGLIAPLQLVGERPRRAG